MLMGVAFTNGDDVACALARRMIWEGGRVIGELTSDAAAGEALYRIGDIIVTNRNLPAPEGPAGIEPEPPPPPPPPAAKATRWEAALKSWGMIATFVAGYILALLARAI